MAGLGLEVEVRPAEIDESLALGETAETYTDRLARAKALASWNGHEAREVIVAADTVVVLEQEILGKPRDRRDAATMLTKLSGRRHRVMTGVAVCWDPDSAPANASPRDRAPRVEVEVVTTDVYMAPMTPREIDWYVATREPDDKAGSYAVQGIGALFVEKIRGNYTNVVGLPLPTVYRLLARAGFDLLD